MNPGAGRGTTGQSRFTLDELKDVQRKNNLVICLSHSLQGNNNNVRGNRSLKIVNENKKVKRQCMDLNEIERRGERRVRILVSVTRSEL